MNGLALVMVALGLAAALVGFVLAATRLAGPTRRPRPARRDRAQLAAYRSRRGGSRSRLRRWTPSISGRHRLNTSASRSDASAGGDGFLGATLASVRRLDSGRL